MDKCGNWGLGWWNSLPKSSYQWVAEPGVNHGSAVLYNPFSLTSLHQHRALCIFLKIRLQLLDSVACSSLLGLCANLSEISLMTSSTSSPCWGLIQGLGGSLPLRYISAPSLLHWEMAHCPSDPHHHPCFLINPVAAKQVTGFRVVNPHHVC